LKQLKLQSKVFHNSNDAIVITDSDGIIIDVNHSFEKMTKYKKNEVIGKKPSILKSGKHDRSFYENMWDALISKGEYSSTLINSDKEGNEYIQKAHIFAVYDEGNTTNYVGILSDITQKQETKKKLYQLANYDLLTNIPNRNLMYDLLKKSLIDAKRDEQKVAILYIDLDDFKTINDSLGHGYGDMLLIEIVQIIKAAIRESDILCRVGGDEFILIAKDVKDDEKIKILATKVLGLLKKPFIFNGISYKLSASMGISVYPEDANDVDSMIKHSDMAMYKAKHSGKNNFSFFDETIQQELLEKINYENSMNQALQNDEFIIFLQPKIDPYTQSVYSLEALVRWEKKGR
jgi:diguanylate cyclase (GGDEF)-like protein/PAS domain S-box-containing protein